MSRSNEEVIGLIEDIRQKNNVCWMNLLKLAFRASPKEARDIMKRVADYDRQVNELTLELCREENDG